MSNNNYRLYEQLSQTMLNDDNFPNENIYESGQKFPFHQTNNNIQWSSNKNLEALRSLEYKLTKVKGEDNIYFICAVLLINQVQFQQFMVPGENQLRQQNYETLSKIIENRIALFKSDIKDPEKLIELSETWFAHHKQIKNGITYINYYHAFSFWNHILNKQFDKFKSFLNFLKKKNEKETPQITYCAYSTILDFCTQYQISNHQNYYWDHVLLLQEFLKEENQMHQLAN